MKYKKDNCKFCKRSILNKGSLVSHIQVCLKNKNRIKRIRSPKAGRKKGKQRQRQKDEIFWNDG